MIEVFEDETYTPEQEEVVLLALDELAQRGDIDGEAVDLIEVGAHILTALGDKGLLTR